MPLTHQRALEGALAHDTISVNKRKAELAKETPAIKIAKLASLRIDERRQIKSNERVVHKEQQELSRKLQAQYKQESLTSKYQQADLATLRSDKDRTKVFLNALKSNRSDKSAYERDGSLPEIPENKLESIPNDLLYDIETGNEYKNVQIHGSPKLQARLRELVEEYKTIFRSLLLLRHQQT
jgi:hypothetical protein